MNKYLYFCDTNKCDDCSFPECSHTTDENHRLYQEGTEMRLLGASNNVNYYMEFIEHPFIHKKFNMKGD